MYVCIYLCDYSACATSFRRRPHPLTVANLSWLPFTRLTVCRLKLQTVGQLRVGIKSSFGIESELWFANLLSSLVSRELVCCRFATTAGALRLRSALKTTRERERVRGREKNRVGNKKERERLRERKRVKLKLRAGLSFILTLFLLQFSSVNILQ